jgi:hypothetical protein
MLNERRDVKSNLSLNELVLHEIQNAGLIIKVLCPKMKTNLSEKSQPVVVRNYKINGLFT